jgi:hypothetical protein
MRYMTYTNSNGGSVILGQVDYPITSIDGLGVTEVEIASQKAPYQDGSTWIDNTLADREISIEGAINKPKDMPEMYAAKSALMAVLNPKLGQGTLVYTDDNGSRQVTCTPQITFASKDGTDPFLRYSVTFTCNDPYFYATTESQITVPGQETGTPDALAGGQTIDMCELQSGNYMVMYEASGTYYLREWEHGVGFGSAVTITQPVDLASRIVEDVDGDIRIYTPNNSDLNKIYLTIYNGSTFSTSAKVIDEASNGNVSVCRSISGNPIVAWSKTTADPISTFYFKEYDMVTSAWLGTVTVGTGNISGISIKQDSDGKIFYSRMEGFYSVFFDGSSIDNGSLSIPASPTNIETVCFSSNYTEIYISGSAAPPTVNAYHNGMILTGSKTFDFTTGQIFVEKFGGSGIVFFYDDTVPKINTFEPDEVLAPITGHAQTPVVIRFNGPARNPKLVKSATKQIISIITASMDGGGIAVGDYIEIDTALGKKSVRYVKSGVTLNGMRFLDVTSEFFELDIGGNLVYYASDEASQTNTVTMKWRERYLGA